DLVDITGIDQSAGASYAHGQCTWWAAIRPAQIGRRVDPYMGNGGSWDASARRLGMHVTGTPHAGDAICFHPGVLGAD
ncbi:CHAP domain-containing protein, partial [Escherichia coli]|uniref:CHAP domain-containing protein n=1 Tax=Escherichia coli TaxID=562 RepID=UPI0028DF089C